MVFSSRPWHKPSTIFVRRNFMKRSLALTFTLLLSLTFPALAQDKIVDIDIFKNEQDLASDHKELNVSELILTKVAKKILDRGENHCNEVESSCSRFINLEEEKVVQLTLNYEKSNQSYEDLDNFDYVKFNFPLSVFSSETLETIRNLNRGVITNKKKEATQNLVKKLFSIESLKVKKIIETVDLERSIICESPVGDYEFSNCEDQIIFKREEITVDRVKVLVK